MHASIPIFTVKDVIASLAYFRDKLGSTACATSTLPTSTAT